MSLLSRLWQRYWFGFEIERSRLAVLRVLSLGLLAWDLWRTYLPHAPRYGAGGLNASQIARLDPYLPLPTPAIVGAACLVMGYLALRAALGVAVQGSVRWLALSLSALYLWSQIDSYQHHYFLCLVLIIFSLFPQSAWHTAGPTRDPEPPRDALGSAGEPRAHDLVASADAPVGSAGDSHAQKRDLVTSADTPAGCAGDSHTQKRDLVASADAPAGSAGDSHAQKRNLVASADAPAGSAPDPAPAAGVVRHYAARMLYVQIALLYSWTAVTKTDPTWLSGHTLQQILSSPGQQAFLFGLGAKLGFESAQVFPIMAHMVMIGQACAALIFLFRPLWGVGLLTVPFFHIFIELSDFNIVYFSYYMIALDVILLCPSRLWRWLEALAHRLGRPLSALRARLRTRAALPPIRARLLSAAVALTVGLIIAQVPIEGSAAAGLIAALFTLSASLRPWPLGPAAPLSVAARHLLSVGALWLSVQGTDAVYDYYRHWGGDLMRRGALQEAAWAYERANAASEGPARLHVLGRLHERLGEPERAPALWHEAQRRLNRIIDDLEADLARGAPSADLYFELGEQRLRLWQTCTSLSRTALAQGQPAARAEATACAQDNHRRAQWAFTEGLKHAAGHAHGLRGLRGLNVR